MGFTVQQKQTNKQKSILYSRVHVTHFDYKLRVILPKNIQFYILLLNECLGFIRKNASVTNVHMQWKLTLLPWNYTLCGSGDDRTKSRNIHSSQGIDTFLRFVKLPHLQCPNTHTHTLFGSGYICTFVKVSEMAQTVKLK